MSGAENQPVFLDTNVLLYSISTDPKEVRKRERALRLLDCGSACLSVQVLQEFYVQATRASRTDALSHEIAAGLIRAWRRFQVQEITLQIFECALEIKASHRFSYWDSAIIAAAGALGCKTLYSEDLSHGRNVEGIAIINPFRD